MDETKEDKIITCACGEKFTWPVREQNFYQQKGFAAPKRCGTCRKKRKMDGQDR